MAFQDCYTKPLPAQWAPQTLQRAWFSVLRRNPILRARFEDDGRLFSCADPGPQSLRIDDWSGISAALWSSQREAVVAEETQTPLDPVGGPLVRARLVLGPEGSRVLFVSIHHLVGDPGSVHLLLKDLFETYGALSLGGDTQALPVREITSDNGPDGGRFWAEALGADPEILDLNTDFPRPAVRTFSSQRKEVAVPSETSRLLKDLVARTGIPQDVLVLAAFTAYLARLSGQQSFVLGISLPGPGAVILPLPVRVTPGTPWIDHARSLAHLVAEGERHRHFDLANLLAAMQVPRDPSRVPLFPALMAFGPLQLEPLPRPQDSFELTLQTQETAAELRFLLTYSSALFHELSILRWLDDLQETLRSAVTHPETPVQDLGFLSPANRQLLVEGWNPAPVPRKPGTTALTLIETQAALTPGSPAVDDGTTRWTYRELDERANFLAHELQTRRIGPEDRVGISLRRRTDMVAALLAIWKAGAAYVPLDPDFPPDRLAFILEDSDIRVLVTERALAGTFPQENLSRIWVDETPGSTSVRPPRQDDPNRLAYILHTSGSTGVPKGVQIEQGSLANFLLSMGRSLGLTDKDALVAVTTLSFDIAGLELYLPLTVGARVFVASREDALDGQRLSRRLEENRATILQATPATWQLLVESGWSNTVQFTALCGGEAFPPDLARQLLARTTSLWNVYGPTETTVWSTQDRVEADDRAITIGRPIENTLVYLVDSELRAVPIGASGELLIGGDGVSRGYWKRPELTADRFLPNPFSPTPGSRVYRTGDICRFGPDGRLHFQRRNDNQVKVRGFRIELGEVETAISEFFGVLQAVAVVRTFGAQDVRLLAYLVPTAGVTVDLTALKEFLTGRLPSYMLPQHIVTLSRFPLTPNGKIDRKALPRPDPTQDDLAAEPEELTDLQARIRDIWALLLKVPRVGLNDSFFGLGGHSLLVARMLGRVKESLGVEVPMRAVFHHPRLEAFCGEVAQSLLDAPGQRDVCPEPVSRPRSQEGYRLTPSQERNRFAAKVGPGIAFVHELRGPLEAASLVDVLGRIVVRHEVLRTVLSGETEEGVAKVVPPGPLSLAVEDLGAALEPELAEFASQPFDLEAGPLYRFRLFRVSPQEHLLAAAFSQLVFDGASAEVFVNELAQGYTAVVRGEPWPVEALAAGYQDFAEWKDHRISVLGPRQGAWWKSVLGETLPGSTIPTDRPRPPVPTFRGGEVPWEVPQDLAEAVRALARSRAASVQMVLLAVLFVLVRRLGGNRDCRIATPVSGRHTPGWEPLIGTFTNMLLLRSEVPDDRSFGDYLESIRTLCLDAYENQDIPLDQLGLKVLRTGSETIPPLFQLEFNFEQSTPMDHHGGPLEIRSRSIFTGTVANELTVTARDTGTRISGTWEFAAELFDRETIQHWRDGFMEVLRVLVTQPSRPSGSVDFRGLSQGEDRFARAWASAPRGLRRKHSRFTAALRLVDDRGYDVLRGVWGDLVVNDKVIQKGVRLGASGSWEVAKEPRLPKSRGKNHLRTRVFDPVEFRLVELYEKSLGIESIGIQDSFFDLGGHSILAVQILNGVKRHFGVQLSLGILFEAPTPFALAKVVRQACGIPDPETKIMGARTFPTSTSIVSIQPQGTLPPLFVAAGVGGNPMNLRYIAKFLGTDQPFYGLQHRGTDGRQPPHRRLEDMVAEYLHDIRTVQPQGPYYLGGFSAGGIAAFEVARELLRMGEQVALVVMFDAASHREGSPGAASKRNLRWDLGNLLAIGARVVRKIRALIQSTNLRVGSFLARWAPYRFRQQAVTAAWLTAVKDYVPSPLKVDVLVLRSGEREERHEDSQNGWGSLVEGELKVINVEGNHLTHIDFPHVATNSEILKAELERVRHRLERCPPP